LAVSRGTDGSNQERTRPPPWPRRSIWLTLVPADIKSTDELETTFADMKKSGAGALFVTRTALLANAGKQIADLATAATRLGSEARNRCLSGAELEVRIHSPPALSHVRTLTLRGRVAPAGAARQTRPISKRPSGQHTAGLRRPLQSIFPNVDYAALIACPGDISRPAPSGTALALVAYLFLHHLC
jgi:hypothetical protein